MPNSGMYLLITPVVAAKDKYTGSHIRYMTKEEFVEEWDSGKLDKLEFVDHLEFDFNLWNVHVEESKIPAVLISNAEAFYPFITETVITKKLAL